MKRIGKMTKCEPFENEETKRMCEQFLYNIPSGEKMKKQTRECIVFDNGIRVGIGYHEEMKGVIQIEREALCQIVMKVVRTFLIEKARQEEMPYDGFAPTMITSKILTAIDEKLGVERDWYGDHLNE